MGSQHRAFFYYLVIRTMVPEEQVVGGLKISMVVFRGMFELLLNRLVAFFLCNSGEPLQYRVECIVWDRYIVGELGAQLQWCLTSVAPATMSMFLLFALCQ